MRLLLDTHVLLWAVEGYAGTPAAVREAVTDPANELFVSIASLWEVAIKISLRKLTVPGDRVETLFLFAERTGMTVLPVAAEHLREVERLPWLHRDPFDRMIVAQSRTEGLRLVRSTGPFTPMSRA